MLNNLQLTTVMLAAILVPPLSGNIKMGLIVVMIIPKLFHTYHLFPRLLIYISPQWITVEVQI